MTTLSLCPRPLPLGALVVVLGLSVVVPAVAQQPAPPVQLPPPTAPAAAPSRAPAPVPSVKPQGPPPDSVRPAAARVTPPPATAVAQCGDGTFIVPPGTASGCAAHRGLRVVMPARPVPPPPAATRAVSAPMALQAGGATNAPPPAGATMRCKDGTYLGGTPSDGACTGHGGIAAALMGPRPAPAAPAQVRRP